MRGNMKPITNSSEYRENPVFMELVSILGNGFILSLFNIDFLFFEYLFPIVGSAIMLFGCHLIKDYNDNFTGVYYLAIARFLLMMFNFLLDWTSISANSYVAYTQIFFSAISIVFLFIYLDKAFENMYQDAKVKPYKHLFSKYIFLYLCNVVCTYLTIVIGILGALISIVVLLLNVLYIALVFHQTGKDLTTSALEIELTSFTKKNTHKYILFIVGYVVVLIFVIYCNNKQNLFEPQKPGPGIVYSQDCEKTKQLLVSLGMKQNVVDDLSPTECNYLATAKAIASQTDMCDANGGVIQFFTYRITLDSSERILVYYHWLQEPSNRLFQVLEFDADDFYNICELSSRCLYDDSKTHQPMEIVSIEDSTNINGHPYTDQKLANTGDSLRGYLAFSYALSSDLQKPVQPMQLKLYYQVSIFNLPYLKIVDYMNYYDKYVNNIVYNRLTVPITSLYK